MNLIQSFNKLGLAISACLTLSTTIAAAQDGVVAVKLGQTIARSLDDVKAAGYAYGPKQDADPSTGETRVYLPYGKNPKLYYGEVRGGLGDASATALAEFCSLTSNSRDELTYKLEFDKPISGFKFSAGYSELVMGPTCVAGVEYSVDGKDWKTLKETPKGTRSVVAPFADKVAATGLNTKTLFLRLYARDSANPAADTGPEMYFKLRISGDPGWGDAATTFFTCQNQIWVTEAK